MGAAALPIGAIGASALSSLFAPEGQDFESFEGETGPFGANLDPRHNLERAMQTQEFVRNLLEGRAQEAVNLPSSFVQQPGVFTGGGLPMDIGVTSFDQGNPFFSPRFPGQSARFGPGANPGAGGFTGGGPPGGGGGNNGDGGGSTRERPNTGPGDARVLDTPPPNDTITFDQFPDDPRLFEQPLPGPPALPFDPGPLPPPILPPPSQPPGGGGDGPSEPRPGPAPRFPDDIGGFFSGDPRDDFLPDTEVSGTVGFPGIPSAARAGGAFDPNTFTADPQRNGAQSEMLRLLAQFGIDPTKKVT